MATQERWLIESGRVAPWAKPGTTALENAGLAGQAILVEGKTVTALHPLVREQAEHAFIVMPAEGLFEGGLPTPVRRESMDAAGVACRRSFFGSDAVMGAVPLLGAVHPRGRSPFTRTRPLSKRCIA